MILTVWPTTQSQPNGAKKKKKMEVRATSTLQLVYGLESIPPRQTIPKSCGGVSWTQKLRSLSLRTRSYQSFSLSSLGCSSVVRASDRHAAEAGSITRCGKGFFSQSQLSVHSVLLCPYSPRVHSHALTSVHTLRGRRDPRISPPAVVSATWRFSTAGRTQKMNSNSNPAIKNQGGPAGGHLTNKRS